METHEADLSAARRAADECRGQGISGSALARFGRRCDRCIAVLTGPIRHMPWPDGGLGL